MELPLPMDDLSNLDHLITDDNVAAENFFVEKQRRLLTHPLHGFWSGPGNGRPFIAAANGGVFFEAKNPAFVPDMFLSLDVRLGKDLMLKRNRSYFCWLQAKVPDVMLEIVADRNGGEETFKMQSIAECWFPFTSSSIPWNISAMVCCAAFDW